MVCSVNGCVAVVGVWIEVCTMGVGLCLFYKHYYAFIRAQLLLRSFILRVFCRMDGNGTSCQLYWLVTLKDFLV